MEKILIFSLIFLLIGITSAFSLSFDSDSKITKVYSSSLCSFSTKCDINTPTEIDVDFEKDSKTGVMKIDYAGVLRSSELNIGK